MCRLAVSQEVYMNTRWLKWRHYQCDWLNKRLVTMSGNVNKYLSHHTYRFPEFLLFILFFFRRESKSSAWFTNSFYSALENFLFYHFLLFSISIDRFAIVAYVKFYWLIIFLTPRSPPGRAALFRSVVTFCPFKTALKIVYQHFINSSSGLTVTDFLAFDDT
jgi:hypothetical protein